MKLSVVATLYRAPEAIPELLARLQTVCDRIAGTDFEIILIDDGCPLGSGQVAEALIPDIPQLRVISLSKNFGQHKACIFGLQNTVGEWVFLMDGDLDEDPELLETFWKSKLRSENEVIFGVQQEDRRGPFDKFLGRSAYRLISKFSNVPIERNQITARLMSRKYVSSLLEHKDQVPWLFGLFALAGHRQAGIAVRKHKRSVTAWTFGGRLWQLFLGLTSFSSRPISIALGLALGVTVIGVVITIASLFRWLSGSILEGWTSLLISVWLLGGVTLFVLAILGQYISVIVQEVKSRPYVVVSRDAQGSSARPSANH